MAPRVRRSLQEIEDDYHNHYDRETLQKLIRAFKGIQEEHPSDPNSFYALGGWHGEPFRGPGKQPNSSTLWWGGYCNHGNVLFPTWHRAYLLRLEEALQSVEGCEDVMMPFWDECLGMDQPEGQNPVVIPSILTSPKFKFDNEDAMIDNPLYSYKLAKDTSFHVPTPWDKDAEKRNTRYSKPKGYQTCRFPRTGLVATEEARSSTNIWNDKFRDSAENTRILNANVANWLEERIKPSPNPEKIPDLDLHEHVGDDPTSDRLPVLPDTFSVYSRYRLCLDAPNYTVFSNSTSATQWIKDSERPNDRLSAVSIESPHNAIHLAVGGFYQRGIYNANDPEYQHACGDMGDNETASFDPIFFFHHCFIDYVFWVYQQRHKLTGRVSKGHQKLSVIFDYEGTITDNNGSPVGLPPGSILDMNTNLMPFRHRIEDRYLNSHDLTDIESEYLNYTYGTGSLDSYKRKGPKNTLNKDRDATIIDWKHVRGINRAAIEGSFVIRTFALSPNRTTRIEIGREPILSRLNVRGCKNCQTHLEAESFVPVYQGIVDFLADGRPEDVKYEVHVETHNGVIKHHSDERAQEDHQQGGLSIAVVSAQLKRTLQAVNRAERAMRPRL